MTFARIAGDTDRPPSPVAMARTPFYPKMFWSPPVLFVLLHFFAWCPSDLFFSSSLPTALVFAERGAFLQLALEVSLQTSS